MQFMIFIFLFLLSFAASTGLTHLLRGKLIDQKIMDQPNERSMHETPVPRGGGLALLIVFLIGLLLAMPVAGFPALWLFIALLILGGISFYDDKRGARISFRLLAQLFAALLGCLALGNSAPFLHASLPLWLDRAIIIIGWIWFMNLYNFMDGIDGITGTQSIACALGTVLVFTISSHYELLLLTLPAVICGACAGFLLFNWHPAKIFLGDVGSIPLGFLTGFLLLKLAATGMIIPAVILPLYYLADSSITLFKRIVRGEKFWQAHRQHFYQRAAVSVRNHDRVVSWILKTDIALIALAALALWIPFPSLLVSFMVVAILLVKMRSHQEHKDNIKE
jgi:UDP-N-acetylmuramyl pentapeptide phosphotransferase/UDP-N-acetylglucosamine-1-phosphate transferase